MKNNKHLRVVTVYIPCVPPTEDNKTHSSHTIHCQHIGWLLRNGDTRQPRCALFDDLHTKVVKWKEERDSVIIMGDFNEDVRNDYCQQWRNSLGMRDVIMNRVEIENIPTTHIRGSEPIDSIWATVNIEIKRTIISPQEDGVGDHRQILIYIS